MNSPFLKGLNMTEHNNNFKVDFFVVGMPRCGTTTLYELLKQHQKIFLPKMKEPHYFAQGRIKINKSRKIAWQETIDTFEEYKSLYNGSKEGQLNGDMSVSYSVSRIAPFKIKEHNPNSKIIMLFRDPITFLESNVKSMNYWGQEKTNDIEEAFFSQYTDIADFARSTMYQNPQRGHYDSWFQYELFAKRYLDIFGKDRVLFLLYDDIKEKPIETYTRICSFLGIEPEKNAKMPWENKSKVAKGSIITNLMMKPSVQKIRGVIPRSIRTPIGKFIMSFQKEDYKHIPKATPAFREMLMYELMPMVRSLDEITGLNAYKRWYGSDE